MSRLDSDALSPFRRADVGPVFDEPWQAQVLAMADALVAGGKIKPHIWSETLGAELRILENSGAPDTPGTYYVAVLRAVEKLAAEIAGITESSVAGRCEDWKRAYLATPHGAPVELENGCKKSSP